LNTYTHNAFHWHNFVLPLSTDRLILQMIVFISVPCRSFSTSCAICACAAIKNCCKYCYCVLAMLPKHLILHHFSFCSCSCVVLRRVQQQTLATFWHYLKLLTVTTDSKCIPSCLETQASAKILHVKSRLNKITPAQYSYIIR